MTRTSKLRTFVRNTLMITAVAIGISSPAYAYDPNVTRQDIIEGGGHCAGNLCTINGRTWDCTGGGRCSLIQLR